MRQRRHKSVRQRVAGSPHRPRLNVFRSLRQVYAQLIDDETGATLASASTLESEIKPSLAGLSKTERAGLVGAAIASRALEKGIRQVVFDRGGYRYHGRVRALAEAARKGGLEF